MNLQYCMDAKSLQRLINALIEDKKVRSMKATIKIGEKVKIVGILHGRDLFIKWVSMQEKLSSGFVNTSKYCSRIIVVHVHATVFF